METIWKTVNSWGDTKLYQVTLQHITINVEVKNMRERRGVKDWKWVEYSIGNYFDANTLKEVKEKVNADLKVYVLNNPKKENHVRL